MAESPTTQLNGPETAYRLRLTAEGRSSLVMQQSLDPNLNQMVWGSLPPMPLAPRDHRGQAGRRSPRLRSADRDERVPGRRRENCNRPTP